jgi:hypothetical protein
MRKDNNPRMQQVFTLSKDRERQGADVLRRGSVMVPANCPRFEAMLRAARRYRRPRAG